MIKKGEIYIFEQPKHIYSSIVIIENEFPINESMHKWLEELSFMSDIYFIFNDFHFPKSKNINKEKFSKLYKAGGMIDSIDEDLGKTLFKFLDYDITILQKHLNFLILDTTSTVNKKTIENFINVSSSTVMRPVLKINRLTSEEFYNIYHKNIIDDSNKNNNIIKNLFYKNKEDEEDIFGMYCSYTSNSSVIFFKLATLKPIVNEYLNSQGFIQNIFVKSFCKKSNIRYLISNIIKYLGIMNLDINLEDVSINNK